MQVTLPNNLTQRELTELLFRSFHVTNDTAGFVTSFTDLFIDANGNNQFLYPKQVAFLNHLNPDDRLIVMLKARQCLPETAFIYTKNGIKSIKELYETNYRGHVFSKDNNLNNVDDEIIDVFQSGIKEVFEIKLYSGESLELSSDHKVNTTSGFIKLSDLKIGDEIINYEGNFGNNSITEDECILMGYFITDGHYGTRFSPKFTNINLDYLDEFDLVIERLFGVKPKRYKKGRGFDSVVTGGINSPLSKYLDNFNLKGLIHGEKCLPNYFLNLNKKHTSILLNRIFAGDGWYSGKNKNEVGIGSPSLEFLHQISYLLSKYGIHTSITKQNQYEKPFYKLRFSKFKDVNIFVNEIGIKGKYLRNNDTQQNFSKKPFNKIVSIKSKGLKQVYDISTKKYNSFIANGIHVHNCGISTAIVGKCIYDSYFNKVPEICIISATKTQAVKVLRRIRESFSNMPDGIRAGLKIDNAQHLQLQNNCNIYSLSSNPNSLRGFTGSWLCDEFAIHSEKDSETIYEAIYPSISTNKNARLIFVSTPLGSRGMFWKLATKSLKEISGNESSKKESVLQKKVFKIRWQDVPHIVHAVEKEGLFEGLSEKSLQQEYLLQFLDELDDAFFTYQFLMDCFIKKESDDLFAKSYSQHFYESYFDLGIPDDYLNDLDKPLSDEFIRHDLQNTYRKIIAGWDIASSRDDSILTVLGERRDKVGYYEVVGDFVLNKKIKKSDNTGIVDNTFDQAKYVRRILKAMMVERLTIDNTSIGIPVGDILESFEEVEPILNRFTYSRDRKIAGMAKLKDLITWGKLKRKFDNDKRDREVIDQMTNLYIRGGKIIDRTRILNGKTTKDDYPNALMLAIEEEEGMESGITVIEGRGSSNTSSINLGLSDWKRLVTDDENTVRENLNKIRSDGFMINGRNIL